MGSTVTVTGVDSTVKKMWKYHHGFYEAARKITRTASKKVENEYKAVVPVGKTGHLKRSIKAKNIFNRGNGPASTVMPRATKAGKGFHRHWVAYGTGPRKQGKSGKGTGIMPKNAYYQRVGRMADMEFNAALRAEAEKNVTV